ncbi:5-oxoprolinase subunit PxpA [Pseudoclavibacter chungangensis]|uniref:5-oxoprolinase subunit A n=1 Tax=Pseudoclavibacter chungangensis TaxID=587635 RepID=A0A7J5BQW3_9MICO|nr:5-oxoprolinase subunit PxpA [Pseudoclavibacter chungangensis]KAB1656330.1 5-oxoprolinase subunit PxpA [Pseudoclavibacter chungangensis]NYJ67097.1 UPF0271 protein [Pseudoclavibacter chungangensis]
MARRIDLVADLGEGFGDWKMGDDDALLDIVTSANIACGFHAGDPRIMDRTVAKCVERGVHVGAHPSFPDLVGFGRRAMDLTGDEVRTDVIYQLGALQAFATAHGTRVAHIAPHGRLGNLVAVREDYARAVVAAVLVVDPELRVLVQDGCLADAASEADLQIGVIGIADRAYEDDGTLVPRSEAGAVIHDEDEIAARTVRMVLDGTIESRTGRTLPVTVDSVLLHGDNAGAVRLAQRLRDELVAAGVEVAAPERRR